MTVPPFGGGSVRDSRQLNALKRRWLTQAGNNIGLAVPATNTTIAITFQNVMNTIHFGVFVMPNWNTTVWVTAKSATGCTINFGSAAPANASIDYAVFASEYT